MPSRFFLGVGQLDLFPFLIENTEDTQSIFTKNK